MKKAGPQTFPADTGCSVCGVLFEARSLDAKLRELPHGRALLAVVDGRAYCLPCWRKAGRPWPRMGTP